MPFEIVVLQVGNYIPISPVRDDVAAAYKKGMEWKASKMLLPYKQLCSEKKVEAEIVQIEADDVPNLQYLMKCLSPKSSMLVIGASSGGVSQGVLYEVKYYLKHNQLYIISEHFIFFFFFHLEQFLLLLL
ncbi:hypothetical protein Scep_028064 [Stephania cephalantha]|uniref:Uncharacterized protein n=1 Tax=Stephania cephalantha TaxID=152367 RepID=A0AAP0EDT2_9MAGN